MLIKTRELGFFLLRFLLGAVLLFCLPIVSAIRVPVKHIEGVSHGFIVLHAQDGRALATGHMIQTVEGERVTNEVVLHFKDGSVHDEVTVFSQNHEFRLISDHLKQYGPSFPDPLDVYIDVGSGNVTVHSEKNGKAKDKENHLDMPDDVATGLTPTLLKNIDPTAPETTISEVTTSEKPRVVKLKIHAEGERQFWTDSRIRKAVHYVVHVDRWRDGHGCEGNWETTARQSHLDFRR